MADFASSPERASGLKLIAGFAALREVLDSKTFERFANVIIGGPYYNLISLVNLYDLIFLRSGSFAERTVVKELLRNAVISAFPEFATLPELRSNQFSSTQLADFRRNGVCAFGPYIDQDQRRDILEYLGEAPVYNAHIAGCSDGVGRYVDDPDDPADAYQFGAYAEDVLSRMPHIAAMALNPAVLSFLTHYFGVPPVLLDLHLWWSFPRPSKFGPYAFAGQGFHRDFRSLQDVQFFTGLSDTTDDDGAHEYFAGTHDEGIFAEQLEHYEQLRELPRREAVDRVFFPIGDGYGRNPGDADEAQYWLSLLAPSLLRIPVRAGSSFMIDTMGLHRGVPPVRHRRLVFSARFTATGAEAAIQQRKNSDASLSALDYTLSAYRMKFPNLSFE